MEKAELIITALQQRIGEIVSNYELQIAALRAEITKLVNENESYKKEQEVNTYSQELMDKISDVSKEE
jgi:phage host-nuclease inhibitor protein Gam